MTDALGTIYLIHFDRPYKHAKHYVGWTTNLERRMKKHRSGKGARLLRVIQNAGIGWVVAKTWEGTRKNERKFKKRKDTPRQCPICKANKTNKVLDN